MTNSRDLANLGGGFIQAGGGVQRSVESKLQDVVSVKDFGAVGDGVADDTAAINAATATNACGLSLSLGHSFFLKKASPSGFSCWPECIDCVNEPLVGIGP